MPEETVVADPEQDQGNTGVEETEPETGAQSPEQEAGGKPKTGEVDKTQAAEGEDTEGNEGEPEVDEEGELLKSNQPIPFKRFKSFVDKRNAERQEFSNLKGLLENPDIFRAVLKSKGVTDPKILDEKMKEAGFEIEESPDTKQNLYKKVTEGLDLAKQESWFTAFERMFKELSKPIEDKLSQKEVGEWVSSQESEAKKLAEKYEIEYGQSGKDEKNINTAVGIMAKYLNEHPEDAGLGHVKIFRLAMADKGIQVGKEKGKLAEKKRNDALRRSQMEDEGQVTREGSPNKDWSVSEILAWRRKQKG
mgnify:CR=1 FL=1